MDEKRNKNYNKFLLFRSLAIKINSNLPLSEVIGEALDRAVEIVDLESGSIVVWDEKTKEVSDQVIVGSMEKQEMLQEMDRKALSILRQDFSVESVYLTLDKGGPHGLFSYPIKSDADIVGAILGLYKGERNLFLEEEFLGALGNQLGLAVGKNIQSQKQGKSQRLSAIMETAVAINHEINNPLTAILGNAQLLLSTKAKLDKDTLEKLKIIEDSALRIKEVTQNLMKIVEPVIVEYAGGVKMVDISKSVKKRDET
jgi:K+-sensing histidine kinase KdpD